MSESSEAIPPATPLPTGTVTLLFTDIEGSTRRWDANPDAMWALLQQHDATLTTIVRAHGGHVFKMMGDACCAAFQSPGQALACAVEAQRAVAQLDPAEPVRVRMGIHTGTTDERNGDYFGPTVNRVARVLSAGHGGQVLLTSSTQELITELAPGITLRDLGAHRLKDLTRPERIFQVVAPGLDSTFPALNTLDQRLTNLPPQATTFIGRDGPVADVVDLLRQPGTRLVTLTGPGGVGKTRISLQVGAELTEDFDDGVFAVSLAPLTEPGLVIPTIASSLGLLETAGAPVAEALRRYLSSKHALLILDNFEHVAEAATAVVELLEACPRVSLLVTSRTSLQVYGERQFSVPPMALPDPQHPIPAQELMTYEAVALFVQRARDVQHDFELTEELAPVVADICNRLDGLPLAIELAAARINLLPVAAILERLSDRLNLLTGGAKNLPARQQTLRGAIKWSYDLLNENEKRLFRRLSVFRGGWTLETAKVVCDLEDDLDVFELTASLADSHLIRRLEEKDPRFDMLETVREYAQSVVPASEAAALERQHTDTFLEMALEAEPHLVQRDQNLWLDRLDAERANLRAAMDRLADEGRSADALRLGIALTEWWLRRGGEPEGLAFLRRALSGSDSDAVVRSVALSCAGSLAEPFEFPPVEATRLFAEAEALAAAVSPQSHPEQVRAARVRALHGLADAHVQTPQRELAVGFAEEALTLARQGEPRELALALMQACVVFLANGSVPEAREAGLEAVHLFKKLQDPISISRSLVHLARVEEEAGLADRARALFQEALDLSQAINDQFGHCLACFGLGRVCLETGDLPAAAQRLRETLLLSEGRGWTSWSTVVLLYLAPTLLASGRSTIWIRLWSAVDHALGDQGAIPPRRRADHAARLLNLRETIGPHVWDQEWQLGRSMSAEEAVALAKVESRSDSASASGDKSSPVDSSAFT